MKKHLTLLISCVSLSIFLQSFNAKISRETNKSRKSNSALSSCILIFGIPATTSDYDGNNILFTTVTIYEGNKKYKAEGEFRNSPIGAGHVIYITENFSNADKANISEEKIDKIEFTLSIQQGSGNQQVRAQVVLQFSDGNKIASASPDPAPVIFIKGGASTPKDGSGGVFTFPSSKPFINKAKMGEDLFNKSILKEPVG